VLFRKKTRILFVCSQNICRSPLAEGLLRHHLQRTGMGRGIKVSSAGTRASMQGAKPDQRAVSVAAEAGVDLGRIRAHRATASDLIRSDHVFALDKSNLVALQEICPPAHQHKLSLLLSHLPDQALEDVPDPYYGNYQGFEQVFQLIEAAVLHLISGSGIFD
jgi:low molecular weight protein-tyrosine phosphatase